MSDPGFTRPDLCSIRAAAEQEELAEAVRGGFTADSYLVGSDDPPAPLTSSIDRAIRLSTAAAVLAVAGIAAYISYWHAYAVVQAHGETGITARLEPATIDGLVYASSMVVLYAARHQVPVPALARWLLGLGIAATLTANMAQGWSHGPAGAVVAAWPAVSLVGSYELLVWLIRTSGAAERGPSADHPCNRVACRAAIRSLPISAVDGDGRGRNEHYAPDATRRPAGHATRLPAIPSNEQAHDEVPQASAINDAAVAAYTLSVQAGNPLSERRLAQMFGRTSRRWARARIADARKTSLVQGSSGAAVTAQPEVLASETWSHDPPLFSRSIVLRPHRFSNCRAARFTCENARKSRHAMAPEAPARPRSPQKPHNRPAPGPGVPQAPLAVARDRAA